jgi:cysteine desulfurase
MTQSGKIYLDYAATTPVDPAVLRAMQPYFSERFGNAGSLHSFGQEAIAAIDAARETVAASLGADFREIIFTGSATEANNLAVRGALGGSQTPNHRLVKPRIIVSTVEHESVLETARDLENDGVDVVYLPVDKAGVVDLKKLKASLNNNTVLISVMCANNEVGTVQPIAQIADMVKKFKESRMASGRLDSYPLFHTDASQALQFLDCGVGQLGIDLMTLSSHKIYGPKGAGALYVREHAKQSASGMFAITPQITGGGQEFGLRSGTENIPAIVGFAKAIKMAANSYELADKKITGLRGGLWHGIKKIYPKVEINGVPIAKSSTTDRSLPNILNVYFPGRSAQDLLVKFDLMGLAVSSGSACRARASLTSYVIEALGHSKERARSSVRFSLGRFTTKEEISRALAIIKKTIQSKG